VLGQEGEQVGVALVDALGLAVEVGVEPAGVAGEDAAESLEVVAEAVADRGAAAAGAARRRSSLDWRLGPPLARSCWWSGYMVTRPCWAPARRLALIRASRILR